MTVYVVQEQLRLDRSTNSLVPKFDLSSAKKYGELSYLLSPSASPFKPESVMSELWDRLENFSEDDYLLLVGNPVLIGLSSAIAADVSGTVNFLQWSGKDQSYIPVRAEVFKPDLQD